MSCCSFPTAATAGYNLSNTKPKEVFPQIGQGLYIGINYPGSSRSVASNVGQMQPALGSELVMQNDTNAISSLVQQPQNVFRLTGQGGVSFIQGSNIGFSLPYSGSVGVRILPSTNQINVNNISFVSTINAVGTGGTGVAGAINMTQLTSTIRGYGWADVSPASP